MKISLWSILKLIMVLFLIKCSLWAQNPQWMVYNTSNSILPSNEVTSFAEDHDGNILIGTHGGLVAITKNGWRVYNKSNSYLPSNFIESISVDSNNTIWFGFLDAGIVKCSNNISKHFTTQNSKLPSDRVNKIIVDRLNRVWIATESGAGPGGVLIINDTSFVSLTEKNSKLPNGDVSSIELDNSLRAWIGLKYRIADPGPIAGGLAKFDGINWENYDYRTNGFSKGNISCIEIDRDTIWIGTDRGLSKYNGIGWTTYLEENSQLPNNYVNAVLAESNGVKWLGVGSHAAIERKGALVKYSDGSFIKFDTSNSPILQGYVTFIFIDSRQNKWIAIGPYWDSNTSTAYGGGIAIYNEKGVFVGIDENYNKNIFRNFRLADNYPNPFNPTTTINYSLPKDGYAKIQIFNLLGCEMETLINEYQSAGDHKAVFDGTHMTSGIYFYTLTYDKKIITKKMLLLK